MFILGQDHSVGLLFGSFVGGSVDCLTSLLFYPFAAQFPSFITSYLLAGEAFTGLLASVLASAQMTTNDPSDNLRFSVTVFFLLLAVIMGASALAFLFLLKQRDRPSLQLRPTGNQRLNDDGVYSSLTSASSTSSSSTSPSTSTSSTTSPILRQVEDETSFNQQSSTHPSTKPSNSNLNKQSTDQFHEPAKQLNESMWLLSEPPQFLSKKPNQPWVFTDSGQLFSFQAVISFLENGLLVTLLPRALG
mmetsp:Transcript_37308/g.48264  ORF Transcript_37308/g.48264 Transcript_37308/m.48264 type:complete len:247 (+) Transcript_37308:266-1006(+)